MENQTEPIYRKKIFIAGIVLTFLSAAIFILPLFDALNIRRDSFFGIFFFNYIITIGYSLTLIIYGFRKFRFAFAKSRIEYTLILMVLALISAFSLNREIPIFESSAEWLGVYLSFHSVVIILLTLRNCLPRFLSYLLYCFLGAGMVLYLYFTIYLVPFYLVGFVGGIFLGMSWHIFVPLVSLVFFSLFIRKSLREEKYYWVAVIAGATLPVMVAVVFLFQWKELKTSINYVINETISEGTNLPDWVNISQRISKGAVAEKMIKTDLVYSTPDESSMWGWNMPQRSFDEVKKHDPLVMTASFLFGKPDLSEDSRIKILESMYDSRHQAQERLWSGDELETSNIMSNTKIYPEYRMAYTEKILSVKSNASKNAWRNEQEAIYTFHLPEGGVVTSLSLWINDKEEKAILTSKSKADSAYKTIVGVEQRDPSLIHWQEGNTVSVRVFPCTSDENRRFKVGITTPLKKTGKKLVYQNVYFDGPSGANATESVRIEFSNNPEDLHFPFELKEIKPGRYLTDRHYQPYWEITFAAPVISKETFSFAGHSYAMGEYKKAYGNFIADKVYIDLNSAWEEEEFLDLWNSVKEKEVYVFDEEMIKLNDENIKTVYNSLSKFNFTLFPFYKISDTEKALVISKSTASSANLRDIAGSEFSVNLSDFLVKNKKVRLFNISDELSPYLKTLKELRVFCYDDGTLEDVKNLVRKNKFVQMQEDEKTVIIEYAGIQIKKLEDTLHGKAPDHLLRLFAYNDIMKKVSPNYFSDKFLSDDIIAEAQTAYVVSPVSSLIVLETQKDYDRFGIEESKNSLKNASLKSAGAVPEPQEWFLIFLTMMVVLYFLRRNYISKTQLW